MPNGFDVAPLEDGQIDGLVAYVTNESLLVKGHGFDTTDLTFADNGLPFVAESVIATDDTIANEPDMVKAFLEAEIKGWNDACADPEAGAELAVNKYGVDIDPPLELDKEIAQAEQQCDTLVISDETAGQRPVHDQRRDEGRQHRVPRGCRHRPDGRRPLRHQPARRAPDGEARAHE